MRKVFLDDLPRIKCGTNKGNFDWKHSVGCKLKCIYDDIEEYIEIIDYYKEIATVKFKHDTVEIHVSNFRGNILGKYASRYKYELYDIVQTKSGDIGILERIRMPNGSIGNIKGYTYECLTCNYIGDITENNLKRGVGCPVCNNNKIIKGYNDLWTTHPHIAKLLLNSDEGFQLTPGSNKKADFKCPDCGFIIKNKVIATIVNQKSYCPRCGDNSSYPEKIIFNILEQLKFNFESESVFKWSKNVKHENKKLCGMKRYDFYIPFLNCIIETHGMQHYEKGFLSCGGKSLNEEQENDKLKEELAKENGIKHYIQLDCRYSNLEWIKNNILKSKLNNLFDLTKIDWNKCEEFAIGNLCKEACVLWNKLEDVKYICGKLKKSDVTIRKYLNKGNKLGWCNYDGKKELTKSSKMRGKPIEIFKDGILLGTFPSYIELEKQSEELFGVKLGCASVSLICSGKQKKPYKGFTFKYIEDNKNCI